jgi:hypothetical protein
VTAQTVKRGREPKPEVEARTVETQVDHKLDRPLRSYGEIQFQCLVWLAWELRSAGLGVQLEMAVGAEPTVIVKTARTCLKVRATAAEGPDSWIWYLTWGRGRNQKVRIGEGSAAVVRIKEAAQS